VLVGCSSPLLRPWARSWINNLSLWHMASATLDLRLPSQLQEIAVPWLVPNYTAWWQRHMCMNKLPKVVTWQRNGRELNSRPLEPQDNALTIRYHISCYPTNNVKAPSEKSREGRHVLVIDQVTAKERYAVPLHRQYPTQWSRHGQRRCSKRKPASVDLCLRTN